MQEGLIKVLAEKKVDDKLIEKIIDNGYFLQHFQGADYKSTINSVGDMMYGTKGFSSNFDIDKFIEYTKGNYEFEKFKGYITYEVKNREDISEILNDSRRKRLISEGLMSFRGQTKEYFLNREIPNPFRQDNNGKEISILPGEYRDKDFTIDFRLRNDSTISRLIQHLEPNRENLFYDSPDIFRAEQHYAKQTAGLDISFDIETALFFSNYKFLFDKDNKAYHKKIEKGEHTGVIYCFRFRDPPIKQTKFLISEFSYFQTYTPERILRQKCGLPYFTDFERNISICDIDCIIYLHDDFEYNDVLEPSYMFPNREVDKFYNKLIELRHKFKDMEAVKNIVEYRE